MSTPYDVITDRIVAQLEAGTVPWRKPWNGQAGMPKNLVSGKEYRGINVFLLHCLGYESPYFVTFKQAKKLDGHVRKGERGCPVVFRHILLTVAICTPACCANADWLICPPSSSRSRNRVCISPPRYTVSEA